MPRAAFVLRLKACFPERVLVKWDGDGAWALGLQARSGPARRTCKKYDLELSLLILDNDERLSNYWQYIGPTVGQNQLIFARTAVF